MIDILQAYIDLGVMMQKPSPGNEKQLKQHYKVKLLIVVTSDPGVVLPTNAAEAITPEPMRGHLP